MIFLDWKICVLLILKLFSIIQICSGTGEVTFLDSPIFRPAYRLFRTLGLNFIGRNGESDYVQNVNKNLNRLQKQFGPNDEFFCDPNGPGRRSATRPTSVHQLRPGDIDIIGAMGDSLTAGNGVVAIIVLQVFVENRGISWTIGGDKTWREFLTIPNILKVYNPNLYGYSRGDGLSFEMKTKFNAAEAGAMSGDTPHMAKVLVTRMKNDPKVDIKNDWKLISLLIGPNDFCSEMCYVNPPELVVDRHEKDLVTVLRLIRDNLPRTMFNIILSVSMEVLLKFKGNPNRCIFTHHLECPCFFGFTFEKYRKRYLKIIQQWQQRQIEIANREEFQNRTDFTVNVQLFTTDLSLPFNKKGLTDFLYMSQDCFHFSQKGNALAANALWNNMLEPVGNKSIGWKEEFSEFKCPTEDRPYLATNANNSEIIMFNKPPSPPILINDRRNTKQLFEQMGQNTPIISTSTDQSNKKIFPGRVERLYCKPKHQNQSRNSQENFLTRADLIEIVGNHETTTRSPQRSNLIITPELRYISRQLKSIKLDVTTLIKMMKPSNIFKIDLPLISPDQVEELNAKIGNDLEFSTNLTKYLSVYVPVEGKHNSTGLSKIMSDELLCRYNWDDLHLKLPVKQMLLFNKILFDAWKDHFALFKDYESSIKKQLFDSHNRANRRKSRARQTTTV